GVVRKSVECATADGTIWDLSESIGQLLQPVRSGCAVVIGESQESSLGPRGTEIARRGRPSVSLRKERHVNFATEGSNHGLWRHLTAIIHHYDLEVIAGVV